MTTKAWFGKRHLNVIFHVLFSLNSYPLSLAASESFRQMLNAMQNIFLLVL